MTRTLLTLFTATALTAALAAQDDAAKQDPAAEKEEAPKVYEVGSKVSPKLKLVDYEGEKITMKDLRGKTVVLAWHSFTCPYMKLGVPKIKQVAQDYADRDVVVIGINSNVTELDDANPPKGKVDAEGNPVKPYHKLRKHVKEKKVNFRIMVDHGNEVADLFQAKTTPHVYVIDPEGVVRYDGALDNDPRGKKSDEERVDYLRDALDAVLAGQKVPQAETKPYGCTIKRVPKKDEKSRA